MADTTESQVLIAGAGPIGLTAAIELARRGIDCRIVDPLLEPPQYAKAVGVQPRTLEVFEGIGVLRRILDAAVQMRGQIVYVNGEKTAQLDMTLPAYVPFGFIAIPQYATERILREELAARGVRVERGLRLAGFEQDANGVSACLAGDDGEQTVRARYLVGADGAHSAVRKGLGLTFEGAAFEEQYMLGDLEVDWSMPPGYGIRSMHQTDGTTDDVLVCIPLPGRTRYRMSMLVPDELLDASPSDPLAHGFEGARKPELRHIQAVLDRLSPEPTTAHIHPPTGAQGMNTGIQDAHNLAWKLALAVTGDAAPGLLDSYDAERRPVGEEVVRRTVRRAREGIGVDSTDIGFVTRREGQLLIDYGDSPIVTGAARQATSGTGAARQATSGTGAARPATSGTVGAGGRAPDATGLTRDAVTGPLRLYSLLGRREHTTLLYADDGAGPANAETFERVADAAVAAAHGHMDVYLITAPGADVAGAVLPLVRDSRDEFARAYSASESSVYIVRPDGYLGFAATGIDVTGVVTHLRATFA